MGNVLSTMHYPHAYNRIKDYLKDMLRAQLAHYKSHPGDRIHSIFKELSPSQIVEDLHHQLEAFWRGEWPFDTPVKNSNSLAWWEFYILVNSLPDERTNSTITWFTSPLRGNQDAQTLVHMIQVGQWYGKHQVWVCLHNCSIRV